MRGKRSSQKHGKESWRALKKRPFRRETLGRSLPGASERGLEGLQDAPGMNQQGILFGRRMSFALARLPWERQGNPAVLRVLEALASRDQELLAVLTLFQSHSPSNPTCGETLLHQLADCPLPPSPRSMPALCAPPALL